MVYFLWVKVTPLRLSESLWMHVICTKAADFVCKNKLLPKSLHLRFLQMNCAQGIGIFWERGILFIEFPLGEQRYSLLTLSCCGMLN